MNEELTKLITALSELGYPVIAIRPVHYGTDATGYAETDEMDIRIGPKSKPVSHS